MKDPAIAQKNLALACLALVNARSAWRTATTDRDLRFAEGRFIACQRRTRNAIVAADYNVPKSLRSIIKLAHPDRGVDGKLLPVEQRTARLTPEQRRYVMQAAHSRGEAKLVERRVKQIVKERRHADDPEATAEIRRLVAARALDKKMAGQ